MTTDRRQVIYLALGPHRLPAAGQHAARLCAQGAQVQLVVGEYPAWDEVELPAGVTVHRLPHPGSARGIRLARRLVAGRAGLARDADLLVAGDPLAFPVAYAAARRHPGLSVGTEPTDPGRPGASPADLAVVTPWYPSPNNPLAGAFVAAATAAVRPHVGRVSVLHTEDCSYPVDTVAGNLVQIATARTAGRLGPAVEDRPEAEVTRVLVPVPDRLEYAEQALARVDQLRRALPTGRIEAPLVHAHTGIYGGLAACRLAAPDARIVVTEHATFLPRVLRQTAARRLYLEVLQRAETLICVSEYLHGQVADRFPQHRQKLRVIPNVIDFRRFRSRPSPPTDLLRWLYLGRLLEHKQLPVLLEAFAQVAATEPRATLTLVGSGPLAGALRDRAAELGLADRVQLLPPVAPERVVDVLHQHDLLVHPSRLETFGMTIVEAIASGTPVLAARSAGPAETMAGIETCAGQVVEVSPDPEVLVTGYHALRARLDRLDLPAAREVLVARYGPEAVATQLREVYAGVDANVPAGTGHPVVAEPAAGSPPQPAPAGPASGRAVIIATEPRSHRAVAEFMEQLSELGVAVDLVTIEGDPWRRVGLAGRATIHELGRAERRLLVRRVEELLLFRGPGKVLHLGRRATGHLGPTGPELAVATLQTVHRRAAGACHRRVFERGYRVLRPWLLWRLVRRHVLPRLDLAPARCVVVAGLSGLTIGARLGRRWPGIPVTTRMDQAVLADIESAGSSG